MYFHLEISLGSEARFRRYFTRIIARIERMTSDPPEMSSQLRSSAPALV